MEEYEEDIDEIAKEKLLKKLIIKIGKIKASRFKHSQDSYSTDTRYSTNVGRFRLVLREHQAEGDYNTNYYYYLTVYNGKRIIAKYEGFGIDEGLGRLYCDIEEACRQRSKDARNKSIKDLTCLLKRDP